MNIIYLLVKVECVYLYAITSSDNLLTKKYYAKLFT